MSHPSDNIKYLIAVAVLLVGRAESTPRVLLSTALKVWVDASLLRRNPVGWIILKHGLEEVQTCVVEVAAKRLVGAGPLWERGLEVWEGCYTWPVLLSWCAKKTANRC